LPAADGFAQEGDFVDDAFEIAASTRVGVRQIARSTSGVGMFSRGEGCGRRTTIVGRDANM
jgi:hypothetical protein